jgi:hypothetical protein
MIEENRQNIEYNYLQLRKEGTDATSNPQTSYEMGYLAGINID